MSTTDNSDDSDRTRTGPTNNHDPGPNQQEDPNPSLNRLPLSETAPEAATDVTHTDMASLDESTDGGTRGSSADARSLAQRDSPVNEPDNDPDWDPENPRKGDIAAFDADGSDGLNARQTDDSEFVIQFGQNWRSRLVCDIVLDRSNVR